MGANYSINVKNKDIDVIRSVVLEYCNSEKVVEYIKQHQKEDYKKFAISSWKNKRYTLVTALEPLLKEELAKLISEKLNCICLFVSCEYYDIFTVALYESGKCISRVYQDDITYEKGIDEDGIPWVNSQLEFHAENFHIDVFCEKLEIDSKGKKIICEAVENKPYMLPDYIDSVVDFFAIIDMDLVIANIEEQNKIWLKDIPENTEFII